MGLVVLNLMGDPSACGGVDPVEAPWNLSWVKGRKSGMGEYRRGKSIKVSQAPGTGWGKRRWKQCWRERAGNGNA